MQLTDRIDRRAGLSHATVRSASICAHFGR